MQLLFQSNLYLFVYNELYSDSIPTSHKLSRPTLFLTHMKLACIYMLVIVPTCVYLCIYVCINKDAFLLIFYVHNDTMSYHYLGHTTFVDVVHLTSVSVLLVGTLISSLRKNGSI